MARTGNFGGFAFDEEVFTGMMQEADYWTKKTFADVPDRIKDKVKEVLVDLDCPELAE